MCRGGVAVRRPGGRGGKGGTEVPSTLALMVAGGGGRLSHWPLQCPIPRHHFSAAPEIGSHPFFGQALTPIPQPHPDWHMPALPLRAESSSLQPTGDSLPPFASLSGFRSGCSLLPPPSRQDVAVRLRAQVPNGLCSNLPPTPDIATSPALAPRAQKWDNSPPRPGTRWDWNLL